MKRIAAFLLAVALLVCCAPALADGYGSGSVLLASLTHNCPNTGIMLPASFSPYQNTYLLTVADWVSRPTFTPTAQDPNAVITVNGQVVRSGQTSQVIPLTDQPQMVSIVVTNGSASNVYTVFLQRRPNEKRTRVSAGYINSIYQKNGTWYLDADLVSINYKGSGYDTGSQSTFTNKKKETGVYTYPISTHCEFYYGTQQTPLHCHTVQQFMNNYQLYGSTLYKLIYLKGEIVAVCPYAAD